MRVLFLSSNQRREASVRFRVMQFFPTLSKAGHSWRHAPFFDEAPAPWVVGTLRGFARRARDFISARGVDVVFVHREIMPLAWNQLVRALPSWVPVVFDVDDAVHLARGEGWRSRLSFPESTRLLVERADVVYAGSEVLVDYASQFSGHVELMPTVVDTDVFQPLPRSRDRLLVGWVGSPSTARYLPLALPALEQLAKRFEFDVRIVGAGRAGRDVSVAGVALEHRPWRLEDEVRAFQELDVGIYPLEDDEWSRGKCGFKAIQYMACGVPFVVSPVGPIARIARAGVEALYARSDTEWVEQLGVLLGHASQRQKLAKAGRARAVAEYSTTALAPRWLGGLERVARAGHAG